MGINRKVAIWSILAVVILSALFIDALPFMESLKKLDKLSSSLKNLEEYTEINNKLEQKEKYYVSVFSNSTKIDEFKEFLISNGLNYSEKDNVIEFNGLLYSQKFKPLIELVQNSSDLLFLEFECNNLRELPIAFGESIEVLKVSGKVKHLDFNRR